MTDLIKDDIELFNEDEISYKDEQAVILKFIQDYNPILYSSIMETQIFPLLYLQHLVDKELCTNDYQKI